MDRAYIQEQAWSIVEDGFEASRVCASESCFSLGNGAMGQRANFEEDYSGQTLQGSYIAGVYYPDKTRVGWWKNGYPEYFAKVLNAPNWIGIHVKINDEVLDLNRCRVLSFRRELSMKEGVYYREFQAMLPNGVEVEIRVVRFLSGEHDELGAIRYQIRPLNCAIRLEVSPYIDAGIKNNDSNWDELFWELLQKRDLGDKAYIITRTKKTAFEVATFMTHRFYVDGVQFQKNASSEEEKKLTHHYSVTVEKNATAVLYKYGGYISSLHHDRDRLDTIARQKMEIFSQYDFEELLQQQKQYWATVWERSDVVIEGDLKAQQGIRYTVFQLHQTYTGKDARLNIGPKGFTGEKYGGGTYWDTEAYCLMFYMATRGEQVARHLLEYRYRHLPQAIANAEKLGFRNGAALYPMVTMDGTECHNEWEITFEEIHRNGAIVYAIYNYARYTGDESYIPEKGLEVMIAICRFWSQRVSFSQQKQKYVILGVTGPNEYENNVNNNWYTNYLACWCMNFTISALKRVKQAYPQQYEQVVSKVNFSISETERWKDIITNMYYPYSDTYDVFLQQEGFLDKELILAKEIPEQERPINQHWSWDRILRSPYIKQADVLQGFYFFEDHFSREELARHFEFYEPFTVHESSLSPCIHSILASRLGYTDQAYAFFLRTSRLDLDDYNKEVHEGLHITSMAGAWLSVVEGFAGMRVKGDELHFKPCLPRHWERLSFGIHFRGHFLSVNITHKGVEIVGDTSVKTVIH